MYANQSKSHKESEVINAVLSGKRVAFLDSACSGNDDLLILEEHETLEDMQNAVENWYDTQYPNEESPFDGDDGDTWSIRFVSRDEWEDEELCGE
jgi:hypothetical protein